MTAVWKAMVLITGWGCGDSSSALYLTDSGIPLRAPIESVSLEAEIDGHIHRVLVDTGFHDRDWVTENVVQSYQDEDEKIEAVLKQGPGWSPEDVEIVINTHLHYDHCGNNKLFTNAQFVVSREEWEFGFNPSEHLAFAYIRELFDHRSVPYFRWHFVDGETEILPGLLVFPTPGHSPGHISVLVNTEDGVTCITGDQCYLARSLRENIINGLLHDPAAALKSMEEIRKRASIIIPGHDAALTKFQTDHFPVVLPEEDNAERAERNVKKRL